MIQSLGVGLDDSFQFPGLLFHDDRKIADQRGGLPPVFGQMQFNQFAGLIGRLRHQNCRAPLHARQHHQLHGKSILIPVTPFGQNLSQPFGFLGGKTVAQKINIGVVQSYSPKFNWGWGSAFAFSLAGADFPLGINSAGNNKFASFRCSGFPLRAVVKNIQPGLTAIRDGAGLASADAGRPVSKLSGTSSGSRVVSAS